MSDIVSSHFKEIIDEHVDALASTVLCNGDAAPMGKERREAIAKDFASRLSDDLIDALFRSEYPDIWQTLEKQRQSCGTETE